MFLGLINDILSDYMYLQSALISYEWIPKLNVWYLAMGHFDRPFTKILIFLMISK
jgi:hypothetical protein